MAYDVQNYDIKSKLMEWWRNDGLLEPINRYSQELIKELNAKQEDNIGLFSIDINKDYVLTIDIASGTSNYYDNIVIWKKGETELDYNEVACLECSFEIGDITLEKEYFDFLNEDYIIKFIF